MNISIYAACLVFVVAISDVSAQWGNKNMGLGVAGLQDCICNTGDRCLQQSNGLYMCRRPTGLVYAPLSSFAGQGVIGQDFVSDGLIGSGLVRNGLVRNGLVRNGLARNGLVHNGLGHNGPIGNNVLVGQGQGLFRSNLNTRNNLNGFVGVRSLDNACCYTQDYHICAVQGYTGLNSYKIGGICNKFFFNGQSCQPIDVYTSCVASLNPNNLFKSIQACQAKCSGVSY